MLKIFVQLNFRGWREIRKKSKLFYLENFPIYGNLLSKQLILCLQADAAK